MDALQDLELQRGRVQSRLAELGAMESTTENRAEITTLSEQYRGINSRIEALALAGDQPVVTTSPTETRQRRELETRASLGEIFDAARGGSAPTGATAELQTALGLDRNQVPLALFAYGDLETRAAATITGDVQGNQQPVIPQVFPQSVSAFLNLDMPTVPVGDALYPVLSGGATVHTPAKGATAAESTGAFTVTTISPGRVQASFRWQREDAARFREMESALRENLNMAIMSAVDGQNLNDATNGLLGSAGLTVRTGDAGAEADFAAYYGLLYDSETIDGSYAAMASDIRLLFGPEGYAHAAGQYRGNSSDMTALRALQTESGGVRVSDHVPNPSSDDQAVIVRKGMRKDYCNPIWEGTTIVFDEITAVGTGEIIITGIQLTGRKLLRSAGFARRAVQVA